MNFFRFLADRRGYPVTYYRNSHSRTFGGFYRGSVKIAGLSNVIVHSLAPEILKNR